MDNQKLQQLKEHLTPFVDSEIIRDIQSYIENGHKAKHCFSEKWYSRHLHFDPLSAYYPEDTTKFSLYGGGLGHGYYINITYEINKGYSFLGLTHDMPASVIAYSEGWNELKGKIDTYFESLKRE